MKCTTWQKIQAILWGLTLAASSFLFVAKAHAGTAFFSYEIPSSGMTKICMYNYLGSPYALTVSSVSICPLTLQVP